MLLEIVLAKLGTKRAFIDCKFMLTSHTFVGILCPSSLVYPTDKFLFQQIKVNTKRAPNLSLDALFNKS